MWEWDNRYLYLKTSLHYNLSSNGPATVLCIEAFMSSICIITRRVALESCDLIFCALASHSSQLFTFLAFTPQHTAVWIASQTPDPHDILNIPHCYYIRHVSVMPWRILAKSCLPVEGPLLFVSGGIESDM